MPVTRWTIYRQNDDHGRVIPDRIVGPDADGIEVVPAENYDALVKTVRNLVGPDAAETMIALRRIINDPAVGACRRCGSTAFGTDVQLGVVVCENGHRIDGRR